MTRRDIIKKWTAYLIALALVSVVNYYVLGPLPISLPLLLPILAVAGGTLEGASFGAVYGGLCGAVMSSLGYLGPGCIRHPGVGAVDGGRPPALPHRAAGGAAAGGRARAFMDPGPDPAGVLGRPVLLHPLREDLP